MKADQVAYRPQRRQVYTPRVIVKFHNQVEVPFEDGVERYLETARLAPWDRIARDFPRLTLTRVFGHREAERLRKHVERARKLEPGYEPPNLLNCFALDFRAGEDAEAEAVAKEIRSWEVVEYAYAQSPPAEPPVVDPTDDPVFPLQDYLRGITPFATDGIDAVYAWGFAGGDGTGVQLVDVEQGWFLAHPDLPAIGLIHGVNSQFQEHGTMVLGVLTAVDNTIGCVGIVPAAAAMLSSEWMAAATARNTPAAIEAAMGVLNFGDVLLLETQTAAFLPIETEPLVHDTIRLATALGIVVVEAAGNGQVDLDTWLDASGNRSLDPADASYKDSGAILVGAANGPNSRVRWSVTNYGERVNCFAWGTQVQTLRDPAAVTPYTQPSAPAPATEFTGTSAASAIIAGAAIACQGITEQLRGYRIGPAQLRAILGDPVSGTAALGTSPRIGVMPNLRNIIDNVLGVAPNVYIRDFAGDTGVPHAGALLSESPDIIPLPAEAADPQAAYGEGSGTENNSDLGSSVTSGQDNFIYVRVRNRGGSAAANVTAAVYWSPPATLVTPNLWTQIGSVNLPNVPQADVLTVAGSLAWPSAAIPASGHYCFVALVGNAVNPAPPLADFLVWDRYLRYVRENNRVAWRNFDVVDPTPTLGPSPPYWVPLDFLFPGAPDVPRRFRLDVDAQLAPGAVLRFRAPMSLVRALGAESSVTPAGNTDDPATVLLAAQGTHTVGQGVLAAEVTNKCRLLVHIPEAYRHQAWRVSARQIFENREVGRVSWLLKRL